MDSVKTLTTRFSLFDYVVFAAMLVVSACIGLYYGFVDRKKTTTSDFLMGGRSMRVFPVSLSVLASFMSAVTLLGTPAEIYQYGTQYVVIVIGYCLLIPAAAYLYLPTFYNLGLTSAYEYLEMRFNRMVRTLGSFAFSIQMIIYMAIVLYAPALALSQVTGISVWLSVASIGIVCTFYTTVDTWSSYVLRETSANLSNIYIIVLNIIISMHSVIIVITPTLLIAFWGGIKAVVVTDVFQVSLMFVAMFVVVFKGASDVGGWEHVWERNAQGQRLELFNFDPRPTTRHTIWNLAIGGYFTWLSVYAVNQAMVQRYLSIPTLKGAQRVIWINLPGLSLLLTICSLAGLVIYAKYHDCDPKSSGMIQAPDQLFPLFVMDTLGFLPGLPGLFVAGIFSGALSTVSSGVNSLAAVTLEDFVRAYIKPDINEVTATKLTKVLAVFFGLFAIALVAVAEQLGDVLQAALSALGMFGGPILGMFSLGMFIPWGNSLGAAVGLLSGLAASFWIGFGAFIHKPYNPKAPISIEGCALELYNTSLYNASQTISTTITTSITTTFSEYETADATTTPEPENALMGFYSISYLHYCTVGCLVSIIVGIIVSVLTGPTNPEDVDPRLITPVFDILCPYLPSNLRKKLRFNVGANVKIPPKKVSVPDIKVKPIKEHPLKNGAHTNQAYEMDNDEKGTVNGHYHTKL